MSKPRKVHRTYSHWRAYAVCGRGGGQPYLTCEQFAWLPAERQCEDCARIWRLSQRAQGLPECATAEMQTTVETIVLAIHRLAECPVVPHTHVWLPYVCGVEGVDPKLNPWRCTCGAFSRDGKTINGESFYGINRSVADVLEPLAPDDPRLRTEADAMRRFLVEVEQLDMEWRRAGSRCGGAID